MNKYAKYKVIPPISNERAMAFWQGVAMSDPDKCWNWKGYVSNDGYGQFKIGGVKFRANRIAYFLHKNTDPWPLMVCHFCDTPRCANPAHLFLGTATDNMTDRDQKNRTARGLRQGAHTHPERLARGERHGRAKLTAEQVRQIRQRRASEGLSARQLAEHFGVSRTNIKDILAGRIWRSI
jgi:hypothetical protein